jgi:hypothetical protein
MDIAFWLKAFGSYDPNDRTPSYDLLDPLESNNLPISKAWKDIQKARNTAYVAIIVGTAGKRVPGCWFTEHAQLLGMTHISSQDDCSDGVSALLEAALSRTNGSDPEKAVIGQWMVAAISNAYECTCNGNTEQQENFRRHVIAAIERSLGSNLEFSPLDRALKPALLHGLFLQMDMNHNHKDIFDALSLRVRDCEAILWNDAFLCNRLKFLVAREDLALRSPSLEVDSGSPRIVKPDLLVRPSITQNLAINFCDADGIADIDDEGVPTNIRLEIVFPESCRAEAFRQIASLRYVKKVNDAKSTSRKDVTIGFRYLPNPF